jgi:alkyl hydroperoxide reductase subunit AhpC
MLKPRKPAPALEFDTVGGGRWSLAAQKPQSFTMVVFYRGLHCPVCRRYTSELNGMIEKFDKRGVSYGVSIDKAREWGLYVSTSRGVTSAGIEEPPLFAEPGLFLVKPKNYPARGEA